MVKSVIADVVQEAEKKARLKDYENSKVLTDEEMEIASELQSKAAARGMLLIPEKKIKSRAKFVQILQENWGYLNKHKYLTSEEKIFLTDLLEYVAFGSNAVVEDIKKKQPVAMNQTKIALTLERDKGKVSKIISSLVKKGVIAKSNTGVEGNNTRSYVLFLNPHVIYSGDRDKVNETLKVMFSKAMLMPVLSEVPERLF